MSTLVKRSSFIPTGSFFDDFLTRDFFDWSGVRYDCSMVPRANIVETDNDFRVLLAAPGMKKEDFHIELENDTLSIYTESSEESQNSGGQQFTRREFNYTSFTRTFHLPNTVDAGKIEAKYTDGILNLVIPKKEEAKKKPIKTINIS